MILKLLLNGDTSTLLSSYEYNWTSKHGKHFQIGSLPLHGHYDFERL